ncbi:DNA repair protein rad16 [Thecaphora frezii]
MPPRRSTRKSISRGAGVAAAPPATAPPKAEDGSDDIDILDAPTPQSELGRTSTTASSSRNSSARISGTVTPATSVDDDAAGLVKPTTSRGRPAKGAFTQAKTPGVKFEERQAFVEIPPSSSRITRSSTRRSMLVKGALKNPVAKIEDVAVPATKSSAGKRKADAIVIRSSDHEDEPSSKRIRGNPPAAVAKYEEVSDIDGDETEDEWYTAATSSTIGKGKDKGKGKAKAAVKDEVPAAAVSVAASRGRRARAAAPSVATKGEPKQIAASDLLDSNKGEDEAEVRKAASDLDVDDSDESDFEPAPRSPVKRRRGRASRFQASSDEGSDNVLSDEDSEEDIPLASSSRSGRPGFAAAGSTREEQQYETTKQRAARLRSEARQARLKKKSTMSQYDKNKRELEVHHPELKDVWEKLQASVAVIKPQEAEQPPGLNIKLLPFQREGLYWLKRQEEGPWKGGMLADEMGMGKTIQMISLMLSDRKKPCLVLAPTVAIVQWRNEIEQYTEPKLKVELWHGANRTQDVKKLQEADVVLTSYAVLESCYRKQESGFRRKKELVKEPSALHSIHWRRIILDEAHNIKERATNTAKGSFALKGDFRWCLSGTPLQNRVGELYSMIRFLGGDPYAYYFCKKCSCKSLHWMFSDRRNCDSCGHTPMHHTCFWNNEILKPIQRNGAEVGEGKDAFARLRLLLERMMLRRTKLERADDMGLPPRTIEVRRDVFNEEEEDLYTSLYTDTTRKFSTYLDQGTVLNNYSNIFTLLTRMRQIANHPDLVLRSRTGITNKLLGDAAAQEEHHVCKICADVAEDAIMSRCRHVFCRECVRQYLETDLETTAGEHAPDCPYCHVTLSIDLEGEALELPQQLNVAHDNGRQGILSRLDMDKWRSSTKIEALVEELTQLRSEDKTIKSLVFSQFVNFLDLIAFRLQRAGFEICRLEGNMSPEARNRTIQHFMTHANVTVFLVSLKAGGVALNLTEASRVYLMDPWWNPSVEVQAMDRIHRLGQHRPIVVKRMVIENSIESRIIELQNKKSAMIEAAIGKDESAMGRLSVADLRFLFTL